MKRIKRLLAAGLILAPVSGCLFSPDLSNLDPTSITEAISQEQAVALATNWLANPAVMSWANSLLADTNLVAQILNAWSNVAEHYVVPVIPPAPDTNAPAPPVTPPPATVDEIGTGRMKVFYGRVNKWAMDHDTLAKEIAFMGPLRVNYHIELAGWAKSGVWYSDSAFEATKQEYRWLVRACRENNLLLMVSLINANMAESKYGNVPVNLNEAKHWKRAYELAALVKGEGSANVIVQPVAETKGIAALKFEREMVSYFKGWPLLYNGSGGSPSSKPSGFKWFSYHPSSTGKTIPKGAWGVSDTSAIIRERGSDADPDWLLVARQLTVDGSLDAKNDPKKVRAWRDHCAENGAVASALYVFQFSGFDPDAIAAMSYLK